MYVYVNSNAVQQENSITFRDNDVTTENQLAPDWISCSNAGTGGDGIPEVCTAALAEDGCNFPKQWYFVDNAQSKSAERTWHLSYDPLQNLTIW